MSLAVADVSPNEIGALAPMVGRDFHNMNHHRDVQGGHEHTSFEALVREYAPHVNTATAAKAADVSTAADGPAIQAVIDGAAEHIESGISRAGNFVEEATGGVEQVADITIGGIAISGAVIASAVDAAMDAINGGIQAPDTGVDGITQNEMHLRTVANDMLADVGLADIALGTNDPALAVDHARDVVRANQEQAFAISA